MKKQIFILIVALFTTTTLFGQMVKDSDPQPLTCTTGPLAPLAGVPYNYAVTAIPASGLYQWWATKDYNFIAGGDNNYASKGLSVGANLKATSLNYGIKGGVNNAPNVSITWSTATLAGTTSSSPTFVVVQNDATAPNCANNLKIYQIIPKNGFTVDIKNLDQAKAPLAYATPYSFCVSNILSATYVVTAGIGAIVTDYGTNVLYFEVVAANFTDGYIPSFKVTGLAVDQTVTSLELGVTTTSFPIVATLSGVEYKPATALTIDPSVINTGLGVSVYVKLSIDNGTHENIAGDAITLSVDGINSSSQAAVLNTNCDLPSAYSDFATQTLTARPAVTAEAATGAFVTL